MDEDGVGAAGKVARRTVQRVENTMAPIRIDTLTNLAFGLGVPVERLLGRPDSTTVH